MPNNCLELIQQLFDSQQNKDNLKITGFLHTHPSVCSRKRFDEQVTCHSNTSVNHFVNNLHLFVHAYFTILTKQSIHVSQYFSVVYIRHVGCFEAHVQMFVLES